MWYYKRYYKLKFHNWVGRLSWAIQLSSLHLNVATGVRIIPECVSHLTRAFSASLNLLYLTYTTNDWKLWGIKCTNVIISGIRRVYISPVWFTCESVQMYRWNLWIIRSCVSMIHSKVSHTQRLSVARVKIFMSLIMYLFVWSIYTAPSGFSSSIKNKTCKL